MGKRIISQARGKGSHTYKVRRKAFRHKVEFPGKLEGGGKIVKLINSGGHSAPLAKILFNNGVFYIPAFEKAYEGQEINFEKNKEEIEKGSILKLKDIPVKTHVFNIESRPGGGGTFIRSSGSYGTVNKIQEDTVSVMMPSKKEKKFHKNCRAVIGEIAGGGRLEKPVVKAGRKYYMKKSKGKLWPRTSAVKMNAIDHPFGSGRAKNPKSKIAKRNAPPGRKVGHLRPRKTGKKK